VIVEEFVCMTVRSRPGESADGFNKRLIDFWSGMLRARKADYERVYAETTRFAAAGDRLTRQYLVESATAGVLADELTAAGVDHDPPDLGDLYSKYEAVPPEWFQIPH
jgi:hypothetical protein